MPSEIFKQMEKKQGPLNRKAAAPNDQTEDNLNGSQKCSRQVAWPENVKDKKNGLDCPVDSKILWLGLTLR